MEIASAIRKREFFRRLISSVIFLVPFVWNLVDQESLFKIIGWGALWILAFCWPLIFPYRILTATVVFDNNNDVRIEYLDSLLRDRSITLPKQLITQMSVEKAGIMVRDTDEWHLKCGGQFYKFRITHIEVLKHLQKQFPKLKGLSTEERMAMNN